MDNFISPKTVKEAAEIIMSEMSGRDKLIIRNTKKDNLIKFHMTWGAAIRDKFTIWSGNDSLMSDAKVTHPDSVSMVIMEAIWDILQSQ